MDWQDQVKSALQEKINSELDSLRIKISNLKKDILSFYSFLHRFLPFPNNIIENRLENKVKLEFRCSYSDCEKYTFIESSQRSEPLSCLMRESLI